jgi:hypothetical protein
MFKVSAAYIEQ